MNINTSHYLTSDKWERVLSISALSTYFAEYDVLSPTYQEHEYNGNTYKIQSVFGAYKANIMERNKRLDNSIAFCGVNKDSDLICLNLITKAGSSGNYSYICSKISSGEDVPAAMCITLDQSTTISPYNNAPNYRWAYAAESVTDDISTPFIVPITRYRYKDMLALVNIHARGTVSGTSSKYTLKDYLDNYQASKPYVTGISFDIYIGTGTITRVKSDATASTYTFGYNASNAPISTTNVAILPVLLDEFNMPEGYENEYALYYKKLIQPDYLYLRNLQIGTVTNRSPNNSLGTGNLSSITQFNGDENNWTLTPTNTSQTTCVSILNPLLDVEEYALKQAAYLGLIFSDNESSVKNTVLDDTLTDEHIYVPEFNQDGVTTGTYKSGAAAKDLPAYNWGYDWADENNWTGGSDNYDMETELNPGNVVATSPFTYQYILNSTKLRQLKNFLYTTVAAGTDETELFQQFLTNNPIDTIVSCIVFPFDVDSYITTVANDPVITGNVDTGITAPGIYGSMVTVLDGGSVLYRDVYEDFRSYEPYCDAEVQIPFHGSLHITPSEFVGHTIGIKYIVDLSTGASIALLFRDGLAIDSLPGQIGAAIRLSGIQAASYMDAVYNASVGYKQAKTSQLAQTADAIIGLASGAASVAGGVISEEPNMAMIVGGISKIASSAVDLVAGGEQAATAVEQAEYSLNHVTVPYKIQGTNTPFTSLGNEQTCRLIIKRPMMLEGYDREIYAHTVGYATCEQGVIGDYTGFLKCAAVDLSGIDASYQEQQLINKLLLSGIIV